MISFGVTWIQGLGILFQYLGTGIAAGGVVSISSNKKKHQWLMFIILGSIVAAIGLFMQYAKIT